MLTARTERNVDYRHAMSFHGPWRWCSQCARRTRHDVCT